VSKDWIDIWTMLGEWGIVAIIWWEFEHNRFDQFLAEVFKPGHSLNREKIFDKYCEIKKKEETIESANKAFLEHINSDSAFRRCCDKEIVQLNMIAHRLPLTPCFRNRVLGWFPHSIVFLWRILSPYVQQRKEAFPEWGCHVDNLEQSCLRRLVKMSRDIVLLDPNRKRAYDISFSVDQLKQLLIRRPWYIVFWRTLFPKYGASLLPEKCNTADK